MAYKYNDSNGRQRRKERALGDGKPPIRGVTAAKHFEAHKRVRLSLWGSGVQGVYVGWKARGISEYFVQGLGGKRRTTQTPRKRHKEGKTRR